jgi:dihydrofolate reductase
VGGGLAGDMISLIVAASTNNVIGVQGELPWRLSGDLKRFKALTMGKPIVMGRLTFESIGRPLPGRQNIVISRQADYEAQGCDVVQSVDAAIAVAANAEEIMIIGGSHIYQEFLPRADRIYLTRVQAELEGDAYFPDIDMSNWAETTSEEHAADESNDYAVMFTILDIRKSNNSDNRIR